MAKINARLTRVLVDTFDTIKKMISVKKIEPIIFDKRGNVAAVARHFGVSRQTIYNRINESVTLQAALEEARETMLDNATTELYDQALDGNTTALIFFLKTQGKVRGFTERQEITGADGEALLVEYVNDWRRADE